MLLLSTLDHPNIVRYVGTLREGTALLIFLEYVPVRDCVYVCVGVAGCVCMWMCLLEREVHSCAHMFSSTV